MQIFFQHSLHDKSIVIIHCIWPYQHQRLFKVLGSQDYIERTCLKTKNKQKNENKALGRKLMGPHAVFCKRPLHLLQYLCIGCGGWGSHNQSSEETSGMMSLGKPNLVYISDSNWKCETMSCGSERDCRVPSTVTEQRRTYSFHPWGRGQSLRGLLYLAFSIVSVTLAVISSTSFQ